MGFGDAMSEMWRQEQQQYRQQHEVYSLAVKTKTSSPRLLVGPDDASSGETSGPAGSRKALIATWNRFRPLEADDVDGSNRDEEPEAPPGLDMMISKLNPSGDLMGKSLGGQKKKQKMKQVSKKEWQVGRTFDLCPLEIREVRPPSADLMPVETRDSSLPPGFRKIRATIDSGAVVTTGPKRMAPGYPAEPSAMSERGLCFVTANDQEVPNEGQVTLPTFSKELVRTSQTWQLAEIAKPLLSVGEECDQDQWVVFTKKGGMIYSLTTGETRWFERNKNGAYEMEMFIPPAPDVVASGFPRPGN